MSITRDAFAIELSLARMAVGFAGRHKDDPGCTGLVHQVQRLVDHYTEQHNHDRAKKLQNIIDWWNAGAVPSSDIAVLSETNQH